ncbi:hypothetical protein EMIHUDRAFT_215635 [Emiliania huxleyi CCMP1516]|uniref:RAP domain-containing protein n=2 Tax=Emiliania huxleyi TaxID=2903 RepID=A0A0D3IGP8_EMIH1|nr:hypothetical protein EMIHUDRAFT_215635 [Emiliania huxleyi CCMP1516]EOD10433.1 hypothetical protein EMIHUDRAFT_215635 [Emiliania huxleyi CCMP1516]|eukprot:XP_005762862.1 hypothetical protein EMIHUDRAFT_215635 [Emiliania huxleyi CCMP1516]
MSNGAPSADAKSGDGRASDGGRDHAMSRGGMSCDGATSVGKASNGRTMTGGMTGGLATTTLGAVVASSEGTLSRNGPMSDGTTSHCAASNGRTMTGGMTSGAATTTLGAEVASSEGTLSHNCPLSDGATSHGEASNGRIVTGGMTSGMTSGAATTTLGAVVASSEGTLSHNCPLSDGATSHGEASNGRIMTGGMMSGAATTIGAEASARATGTIGARIGTTIPGATMTGATSAARGSLSTATAGGLNAKQLSSHISNAGSADALLALFAAHSASLNHIRAANLWNKLGKQRVERRHEEQLEQLVQRTLDLISSCDARGLANIAHGVANDSLARDPSRWSEEGRVQLHQWQLWLSLERLQRSVAAALAAVRHGFEEEHLEPRTGYSLDLALPSSRIAIEVDGPSHFLLPNGLGVRQPNGPTLLKRRFLAAAGWRVISVPFYEWDGFARANERQTYLQKLLG